jgi:hypothetical protein
MTLLNPAEFLQTVYLGDRACKSIYLNSWQNEVSIEVDEISRIRSTSGDWEFYTAEDISNGRIVFTDVKEIHFEPSGPIPNDFINGIWARQADDMSDGRWIFEASISAVAPDGSSTEVIVRIIAADVHLEDPTRIGQNIRV